MRRRRRRRATTRGGFIATLKRSLPTAVGVGAGLIAPPAITRVVLRDKDAGLVGYAGNVAAIGLGYMALRRLKGGKFAAPFVAGGLLQVLARVTLDVAPDIGQRIGLAPLAGSGGGIAGLGGIEPRAYMGGVQPDPNMGRVVGYTY